MVTTYWGFYIDPDINKALLERLVIDPIFFYTVMVLLVPLSFGFTYMMIKLAKHAEANAKLQPKKGGKGAINISQRWMYTIFIALLVFQVYLNIMTYYAMLQGMKNVSLFIMGIIMLVFAAMFHLYRYGRGLAKAPPPKPPMPPVAKPVPTTPKPAPVAAPATQKPLAAPPTAAASKVSSAQTPQLSSQQPSQKHTSVSSQGNVESMATTRPTTPNVSTSKTQAATSAAGLGKSDKGAPASHS